MSLGGRVDVEIERGDLRNRKDFKIKVQKNGECAG